MRALAGSVVGVIAVVLTGACAPGPKDDPNAVNAQPDLVAAASPSAGAMAKRAPLQPGERVSPVIAFRGTGEGWNLQIENAGGYTHDVDLTWGNGSQHAIGSLEYQGTAGAAAEAPILLVGALDTQAGRRTIRVEITSAACADDADQSYTHTVQAVVEGLTPMRGCGDLAK